MSTYILLKIKAKSTKKHLYIHCNRYPTC